MALHRMGGVANWWEMQKLTAIVYFTVCENGKFVVRPAAGEFNLLEVPVLVRIFISSD